jgi:hypothetical protein
MHTLVENIAETFASRKQIKQLREEISQLRADLTTEKAAEHDDVVEVVPQFLQRRRHDAA